MAAAALAAAAAPLAPTALANGLIRDAEIERTLDRMIDPIFNAAGLALDSVPIFIINDSSLNAFVAAGGRSMFFHTGLLVTLEEPEELIGVMAHETGHITGGHIVRRIEAVRNARYQAILTTILGVGLGGAAAAGGAGAGAGVGAIGLGNRIAQRNLLRFTRTQEASADQAALTFMNRAGIDPSGILRVLERLQREQAVFVGQVDPYALTHPLSGRRIDLLSRGVAQSPALGRKVSADIAYWHGRMRAKIEGFLSRPGALSTRRFNNPELDLYSRAITLHRLPDPDRAVTAVDQLIAQRPDDPFYWELKGQILFESGRGPQAVEPYRRALSLAPSEPLLAGGLGEALLAQDTPEATAEALPVLERAAVADPFDRRVLRSLALAYARNGQDGLAAVVTAERLALSGRLSDAKSQARRAQAFLPEGSPGWLRAEDVIALPEN